MAAGKIEQRLSKAMAQVILGLDLLLFDLGKIGVRQIVVKELG